MLNEASVIESASIAGTVSEEARMRALGALEREFAPRRTLPDLSPVAALADRIALHVESLVPRGRARCLEVGRRGVTPVQAIKASLPRVEWQSVDLDRRQPRVGDGVAAEGGEMPYSDGEFDVAVLWNVLHDAPQHAARLLAEASRVARHVLLKDRFDAPSYARTVTWLANLVRHNDRRCDLTRDEFVRFVAEQRLVITALDCDFASAQQLPAGRELSGADRSFIALLCRP